MEDREVEVQGRNGHQGRLFLEEHPMLNPLVVTKIFDLGQPDFETLKNIRSVCKVWHDLSLDRWRSTATLKLEDDSLFRRKISEGLSLTQFFTKFEDPSDPFNLASRPFSRYKINETTIDMSLSEEDGPCKRFWNDVGPLITYLHLDHCLFPKLPAKQFDKMLFSMLPNLQNLVITETDLTSLRKALMPPKALANEMVKQKRKWSEQQHPNLRHLEIYGGIPLPGYKLIYRLPHLESLTIRNGETKKHGDTIRLLEGMSKLSLMKPGTLKLKKLDLMHTNGLAKRRNLPTILALWKLPLEVLSLEIRPDQSRTESPLKPFLQFHGSTLKILKIFCAPLSHPSIGASENFPFDFYQDVLEELYLWGNVTRSFKFLKFMPRLKKIFISRNCNGKREGMKSAVARWNRSEIYRGRRNRVAIQPFPDNMVLNSIRFCDMNLVRMPDLVDLHIDYEFDSESISKLAEWMPNLRMLKTILSGWTFPIVCEKWPKMEELLCLFGSEIDSFELTGLGYTGNESDLEEKDLKVQASISDLEYLKVFEYNALCDKTVLNDWSATHGFLKMKRLETLKICVSVEFTAEAEMSLAKHIPNLRIIRNYGPGPHENYGCCEMSKFLGNIGELLDVSVSDDDNETAEEDSESDLDTDAIGFSDDDDDDDDQYENMNFDESDDWYDYDSDLQISNDDEMGLDSDPDSINPLSDNDN